FGERAGVLADARDGLRFAYDPAWVAADRPPLSQALPLDREPEPGVVHAYFGGLLPEGEPRRLLARRLGVSERNDFALLAAIGGDCAGAITLAPPDRPRERDELEIDWLDDARLAELIARLPDHPMLAGEDGEIRLSLAGAQDKLPVIVEDDRIGITAGRLPSTHILKMPIARFEGTVVNEAFCLLFGSRLGVPTVPAQPRRAGDHAYLLVERYDRFRRPDGSFGRLHQEDFCQALGIPSERKYEVEGGPSLADCFALVRRATTVPAAHMLVLLDAVALNFLVGNHDAHGKNFSLLRSPEETGLAPFYDILSTLAYPNLARRAAMAIGGERRPDYVRRRHLDRLCDAAGLGGATVRRRLLAMAREAPEAARFARGVLADDGWDHPVLDTVLEIVDRRARQLAEIAGPRPAKPRRTRTRLRPVALAAEPTPRWHPPASSSSPGSTRR
ncbi:MAG TPA: type II toxin-antitoxin system HipA family toxin, partial [Conexibacter sp.]|nr:type II toxin-antitoxin system HipA family toxin [Conexibacter sp.]